jgi:hypothetical protein
MANKKNSVLAGFKLTLATPGLIQFKNFPGTFLLAMRLELNIRKSMLTSIFI